MELERLVVDALVEEARLSEDVRWESGGRPPGPGRRPGSGLEAWFEWSGSGETSRAGGLAGLFQAPGLHMAGMDGEERRAVVAARSRVHPQTSERLQTLTRAG